MKKIIGIFSMLYLLAITLGSCTDAPEKYFCKALDTFLLYTKPNKQI